jgi:protein-S-isoprenylcysteine O-methyltransferase Ste14
MRDTSSDAVADNPGLIAPPPLIYVGSLLVGLLLNLLLPVKLLPKRRRGTGLIFGATSIGLGVMLARSAFQQMRRAKTNINPTQPTMAIVTEGPYRLTRNPIYVALTLLYAGISLLFNSFWSMLLLPFVLVLMNLGVIDREERYLEGKFGELYLNYKRSVRRWL